MKSPMTRRHLPFVLAAGCGLATLVVTWLLASQAEVLGSASVFFVVYLVLTLWRVPRFDAQYLKENAATTDEPAPVIFGLTVGTIVVTLIFLFAVLNQQPASRDPLEVSLALLTVALGWFSIHTMAALHYAHLYWRPNDQTSQIDDRHQGLEFPGSSEPGGWDFLYFAFVVGMTAQTSDVQVTTTAMRRFNLLHAIGSFFFNTVLVAVAVNVAVSIAGLGAQ